MNVSSTGESEFGDDRLAASRDVIPSLRWNCVRESTTQATAGLAAQVPEGVANISYHQLRETAIDVIRKKLEHRSMDVWYTTDGGWDDQWKRET